MNQQDIRGDQSRKVIPFSGEMYAPPQIQPEVKIQSVSPFAPFFFMVCLLGGLSLGAMAVYQSPEQVELRSLKAQAEQLTKLQQEVCR